jgi:hypothetical protein
MEIVGEFLTIDCDRQWQIFFITYYLLLIT